MTRLLHYHDSSLFQRRARLCQHPCQSVYHMWGPRVVKSEQNDAHSLVARECNNLAKIKVKGQNDSRLRRCFLEYLAVWHPLEPFISKMDRVVPFDTQPLYYPLSHSHVRKESHRVVSLYAVCTSS